MHSKSPEAIAKQRAIHQVGARTRKATTQKAQRKAIADQLTYPPAPKNITDAMAYLAWIADGALRGLLSPTAARSATGAIREWISAEGYATKLRDLAKLVNKQAQQADATKPKGRR